MSSLDSRTPVLFLPVYVETRFIDLPGGGSELWVRIYPDQISIDSHEPELTDQEIKDGTDYWNAVWCAGNPPASLEAVKAAWRGLASRYGAPRAAWIAHQLTPANVDQQPAAATPTASLTLAFGSGSITFTCSRCGAAGNQVTIAVDVSSPRKIPVQVNGNLVTIYAEWDGVLHTTAEIARFFPSAPTNDGGPITAVVAGPPQPLKAIDPTNLSGGQDPSPALVPPSPPPPAKPPGQSSWTKPAVTAALPDAWTVVAVSGTDKIQKTGCPIVPDLHVGFNPRGGAFPPGSPVDDDMKWLLEFETARQKGMAVKICGLTPEQRASGFDRIFVYGLRTQDSSASNSLASLLDAHQHTDGFSLVPQGAPTNNTPDASSAYSSKDSDYEISFTVERGDALTTDPDGDGNTFAKLVGVDPSHMAHVRYSDGSNVRNGADMLTVLWPATLGYFLRQIMTNVSGVFGIPKEGPPRRSALVNAESDAIEAVRKYVLTNAMPRGPIPTFRVGRIPYGVLPITSLRRYSPSGPFSSGQGEYAFVKLLLCLWPKWLASAANAPHMQKTGDPDKELVAVLGMDASSMTFRGRQVLGNDFFWNYMSFIGMPFDAMNAWWKDHLEGSRELLDSCGLSQFDPRVIHLAMVQDSFPISLPTVQAGPLSETDLLKADADLGDGTMVNYIEWLERASVDAIKKDTEHYKPGPKPTSLLYQILRQAIILEYANMATKAEINAGRLQPSQVREAEIIGVERRERPQPERRSTTESEPAPVSVWEVLARPALPYSQDPWRTYLVNLEPTSDSPFAELNDFRASLDCLSTQPTAELDRLLTETLDACSHRLDVWATAIATAILKRTRASGISGAYLGCYGWLEDVRPAAQRPAVQGAEFKQVRRMDQQRANTLNINPDLPTPLEPLQDNGGFIYAPSMDQAVVAAVLRNGYMTHKGTSDEGLLSIDLSSERVRKALWLLDGVRQGQSLNALLGYLFESGLHELGLDKYTQCFRDKFPITANKLTKPADLDHSVETLAASNVVDGLALRMAWDNVKPAAGEDWNDSLASVGAPLLERCLPTGDQDSKPEQEAIIRLLKTIDDYADAVGDLCMSEAVFQAIRGNFGRAGGLMDAVSKADHPPPEPDVINTPRSGLDLTHRVALLFAGPPLANAWTNVTQRPRAIAERWLDAWLSQLLPDPRKNPIFCEVSWHGAQGPTRVNLSALELGPLDCLAMADAVTEVPQRSELDYRIIYAAGVPPEVDPKTVQIDYQETPPPPDRFLSVPDFFFLCKAFRSLINSARPLTPQDLTVPEKKAEDLGGAVDLSELITRARNAVGSLGYEANKNSRPDGKGLNDALQHLNDELQQVPFDPSAVSAALGPVREALLRCSFYGVPGSVPPSSKDPDPSQSDLVKSVGNALSDQATPVLSTVQDRYNKASAVNLDPTTAQLADVLEVLKTIFGNDFVVLPQLTPPNLKTLQSAFSQLVATDPEARSCWLMQLTHVRPAISRLDTALTLAQVLGWKRPDLLLGQLPAPKNTAIPDKWLGLPIDLANPPDKGCVAFACITPSTPQQDPTNQNTYAGLLVDEWQERIPCKVWTADDPQAGHVSGCAPESAAVAFHYEEPKASPPRALLLAVCPDRRENWDDDLVIGCLEEALDLTKIRAVDLNSVQKVGQILPALYFPFNLQGATISANFLVPEEALRGPAVVR